MGTKVCFLLALLSILSGRGLAADSPAIRLTNEFLGREVTSILGSTFKLARTFDKVMGSRTHPEKWIPVETGYTHIKMRGSTDSSPLINIDIPPQKFYFPFTTIRGVEAPDVDLDRLFPAPRNLRGDTPELAEVLANPRMMPHFKDAFNNPDTQEVSYRILLISRAVLEYIRSLPQLQAPVSGQPTFPLEISAIPVTLYQGNRPVTFVIPESKISFVATL